MKKALRQWGRGQPRANLVFAGIEWLPRLGASWARRLRSQPHLPTHLWSGTSQRDHSTLSVRPADRIEMIIRHPGWIAAGELRLNQGGCIRCVAAHNPGKNARCCGICSEVGWRQRDGEFNRTEETRHVQAMARRRPGTPLQPTEYVLRSLLWRSDQWQRRPTITATQTSVIVNNASAYGMFVTLPHNLASPAAQLAPGCFEQRAAVRSILPVAVMEQPVRWLSVRTPRNS